MAIWTLDDIAWQEFDRAKVTPQLLSLAKAASMVEHNGHDYATYLCAVFSDDPLFQQVAKDWAHEEVQHGMALRKWAEIADPDFDFDKSFGIFTTGYQLPLDVSASVRGSRSGELLARCIVEIGTSSYYTAIKDFTDEPVLKAICAKIAADELRHYKLFYTHLQRYLEIEKPSTLKRIKVVLSRIAESEDDELSYAFFAAHSKEGGQYTRKLYANRYWSCVGNLYQRGHIDRMIAMAFKAIGLKPHSLLNKCMGYVAWHVMRLRTSWAAA